MQNLFNLTNRSAEALLEYAQGAQIAFIPWFPLATGTLANKNGPLQELSNRLGATGAQLALAWLLQRSPVMLPIPGTSRVAHLEDNMAAAGITLSETDIAAMENMAS